MRCYSHLVMPAPPQGHAPCQRAALSVWEGSHAFLLAVLLDRAAGDREGAVRHRDAGVEADLEQDLLDLLFCEAVAKGGLDVHVQLVLVLEGREDGERDDGPLGAVQARARPDLAPGVA